MDSYRGNLVEQARSNPGSPGDDDDSCDEPPPVSVGQDERRMQVRAYNHWASLLGDRHFPQIEDLTSAKMPDFADHAVVLDFSNGIDNPAVTMLGAKLAEECGAGGAIKRLSDVPGRSLLSRITDHYMRILANAAPIGFEAEFVNQRGKTLLYRCILLPFSSDGENIRHIMGVINWKELADPTTTAALIRELDGTVEVEQSLKLSPPLGEWADGPITAETIELDVASSVESNLADWELADWLASARELARVSGSEDRSRAALYAAIGRAWDFALAAQANPQGFSDIIVEAGLTIQARAPMTPVVKLVFGAEYDKTRLIEFAAALAHARRRGLERGSLAAFLAETSGGLKGVVREERRLRRAEMGRQDADQTRREKLAGKLRRLPMLALQDIGGEGCEFAVLLIRRLPEGRLCWLGEVSEDLGLIDRTARRLLL